MKVIAEGSSGAQILFPAVPEIIVGVIAFALICFVLMKFVFPRMEQTFRARVDAIEGGLKRAEQAQAEANQLLEQYRAQLAEARTEAAGIRDEARADAAAIRDETLARAAEERDRIIAAGRDQLNADKQSLIRELRTEIGSLAVDLAGRIVGESLSDEARRRGTVERFLSEIESGSGDGRAPAGTAGRR
jgi:F-type H+-transporting ATPase subunit b